MRAHYLQHVPFEGLGSIEKWLIDSGYDVTASRLYDTYTIPSEHKIDLLVILGGPMSVNDEEYFPWLRLEKQFIRKCLDAGVATLGICLGAQLIVSACGGAVYPHHRKEIGWYPIYSVKQSVEATFTFPDIVEVFHWHGETFELPEQAVLLASSEACTHQVFQISRNVIGMQCHLETTPESARKIIENCRDDIQEAKFVQPAASMLDQSPEKYSTINSLLSDILSYITRDN
jgi:GMP synthase-like glutamine amidotransferase